MMPIRYGAALLAGTGIFALTIAVAPVAVATTHLITGQVSRPAPNWGALRSSASRRATSNSTTRHHRLTTSPTPAARPNRPYRAGAFAAVLASASTMTHGQHPCLRRGWVRSRVCKPSPSARHSKAFSYSSRRLRLPTGHAQPPELPSVDDRTKVYGGADHANILQRAPNGQRTNYGRAQHAGPADLHGHQCRPRVDRTGQRTDQRPCGPCVDSTVRRFWSDRPIPSANPVVKQLYSTIVAAVSTRRTDLHVHGGHWKRRRTPHDYITSGQGSRRGSVGAGQS